MSKLELKFFILVVWFMLPQAFGDVIRDVVTALCVVSYPGQFQNMKLYWGEEQLSICVSHSVAVLPKFGLSPGPFCALSNLLSSDPCKSQNPR